MTEPSIRAADVVEALWKEITLKESARPDVSVPELGPTSRMIHDGNLAYLNAHRDIALPELLDHLIPLLNSLAERRDELVSELRLLRKAMVAESERLAQRDDALHLLLEARVDQLGRERPAHE